MDSTTRKYISTDESNVVQNEMKFPSGKLEIAEGGEYKDINHIFIKGIRFNNQLLNIDENGIVDLTIEIPEPEPEPEPELPITYFTYYGRDSIQTDEQIHGMTNSQVSSFENIEEDFPFNFNVENARQILVFAIDQTGKTLKACSSGSGLEYGISKAQYNGQPITKTINGKTLFVWKIQSDSTFSDSIKLYWI